MKLIHLFWLNYAQLKSTMVCRGAVSSRSNAVDLVQCELNTFDSKVLANGTVKKKKKIVVRSVKAHLKVIKYYGVKQTPLYSCFPQLGWRKLQ